MRVTIPPYIRPPLIAFVTSIAITVITAAIAPWPVPQFHDEFSYLLAGDTFAHGRLTNPTHPLWDFFETFQVLSQPTYASKYPPGQGIVLALGQRIAREPIVGVWISTALACAAIAWMSQAALARRWATLGGIIAAIHPQVLDWNWSYWGGSVAMLGGALLVGAVLRMRTRASWVDGLIAGIGVAILANSRPLEGAILTLCCAIWIAAQTRKRFAMRVVAAIAIMLAINFAWMGYYNYRVTHSATTLPYSLYEMQYAPTRPLAWLPPPASQPTYRIGAMREFYLNWELPNYERQRSVNGFVEAVLGKLWEFTKGFGRAPTIGLALIGLPFALRRWRWSRGALVIVVICLINALPVLTYFPHYSAPIASIIFLLVVASMRAINHRALTVLVLVGQIVAAGYWVSRRVGVDTSGWNRLRQAFIDEQASQGRRVLVFVRTDPGYYVHNEYVFNSADIDSQAVVWARDLGFARNRELIDYYNQLGQPREVLLLDNGRELVPYNDPTTR